MTTSESSDSGLSENDEKMIEMKEEQDKINRMRPEGLDRVDDYEKKIRDQRIQLEQVNLNGISGLSLKCLQARLEHEQEARKQLQEQEKLEQKVREEMLERKEHMLEQLEELKEAEERQRILLEQEQIQEKERLQAIAKKEHELAFAALSTTTEASKFKYRLRPAQVPLKLFL